MSSIEQAVKMNLIFAKMDAMERRMDLVEARIKAYFEAHPEDPGKRPVGRPAKARLEELTS